MPYVKEDCAANIKESTNIEEIIGNYVTLKKTGSTLMGLCPFHNEKTPSFTVSPIKGIYKCFGCGKSGDAVAFLMEHDRLSYPDALIRIAEQMDIVVEYDNSEQAQQKVKAEKERKDLRPILNSALNHYRKQLQNLPEDHAAFLELNKRQYDAETIQDWEIGFAPGGSFLFDKLKENKLLAVGRSLGLVGDKADKYWNRVIYPIKDRNGLLVGLAGRDVSGKDQAAKWYNSSESKLYNKSKVWYGLHENGKAIAKENRAWIVEGYNDVITMSNNKKPLGISPCGTSITNDQVKQLKRYCNRVVLALDGDDAGTKATVKAIPLFLMEGFSVQVFQFPEGMDPDDFCRAYSPFSWEGESDSYRDGFFYLCDREIHKDFDAHTMSRGVHKMVDLIKEIDDLPTRDLYLKEVAKRSNLTQANLQNLMNVKREEEAEKKKTDYILPKGMAHRLDELKPIIEEYGLFMADHQIWVMDGKERPFYFRSVSNFDISFLHHIQDEKVPTKLVKISNVKNRTHIFDAPSNELNSPQKFDDVVSGYGNFLWTGDRNDFQRLRRYLFDRMGSGAKIDVLGWQPDGFWVFNNAVIVPKQGRADLSDDGVLTFEKNSYYIPSANKIYKNKPQRYQAQKKSKLMQSKTSFGMFTKQMFKVHREHSITALLHTISAMFSDIVYDRYNFFPMLFLFGPASTGKDELIDTCLRFFGMPQSGISIGNNASTLKAKIAKFAQFANQIVYMSEYVAGNKQVNETLKELWNRNGYERRTMDSSVSTETVPILSAIIFNGNQYVDDEALASRIIVEEMLKSEFTKEESEEFEQLNEMVKHGFSSFTAEIIDHRQLWIDGFNAAYKKAKADLKEKLGLLISKDRMINNPAVYGACYILMKDVLDFPFSYDQFMDHIYRIYTKQVRRLNTGSKIEKFWNLFLAAIRMQNDPLIHGREFTIAENRLTFNMTHCYNRVAQLWWGQYQEKAPNKSDVMDAIKQDEALFIEVKGSVRYGEKKTSGWVVNINSLNIEEDLLEITQWKENETKKPSNDDKAGNDPF